MALSIGGLGSGLDTASIVAQLMATERIPQGKVQAAGQAAQRQSSAWSELRTKVLSLVTSAEALRTPAKAVAPTASSSNPAVRVTAGERATPGQASFVVTRLATAQQETWKNAGPASSLVGAGRSTLVSGSLGSGATAQSASDALDLSSADAGAYTVAVTRASSAATAYATAPTAAAPLSATDLTVTLGDGSTRSVALRSDYAGAEEMRDDLRSKLGTDLFAVEVVGGRVQISSADEGAAQSLAFSGGAAAALGLPAEAVKGQNALVTVNGKRQEVEPQPKGTDGTVDVELGDTGILLKVGDALRTGTLRANVVQTDDDDTLSDLVGKLNASGSPVSASLSTAPDGSTTLTTTSTATGPAGAAVLLGSTGDTGRQPLFRSAGLVTVEAQKAALQVGGTVRPDGTRDPAAGGTVHEYDSNTITDLVPGVTFELLYKPPLNAAGQHETVSTSVSRDSSGTKDKVKSLVDAMNGLLNDVKTKTKYDVGTRTGGPLVGNGVARGLSQQLFAQTAAFTPSGDLRSLAQIGISTTRDGTFELDSAALTKALEASPDDVARMVSGVADKIAVWAKDVSQTGGPLTIQRDGADAEVTSRRKQSDAMDLRLQRVEERYRKQFAALDSAMSQLNSQRSAMAGALSGLL